VTPPRPNRLSAAASRSTKRLDERAAAGTVDRVRVSCDLTEPNYRLLHVAVADYRATKIDILNVLVEMLAEPAVAAAVGQRLEAGRRPR
jgi:hypothetical protein